MKKAVMKAGFFLYFFSCFFVVFSSDVHAYIDPSAVTYIIQAVAGVLIALGAVLTIFRHKIKALFGRKKKTGDNENEDKIEFKDVED